MTINLNNILIVGGTGRNIGKSTFAELLIKKFSAKNEIIALKTSMLLPGEEYLHGNHKTANPDEYFIIEEKAKDTNKDSSRFLRAGAKKSYFLSIGSKSTSKAFKDFLGKIPDESLIIAESNVLNEVVNPGIFVMIVDYENMKPSAKKLIDMADMIVPAKNQTEFLKAADLIKIKASRFIINGKPEFR